MKRLHLGLGGFAVLALVAGCGNADGTESTGTSAQALHGHPGTLPNNLPFANPTGYAATFSTAGSVDLTGPFFQSFGTNGRTCGSCHAASDGWTVTPPHLQDRFNDTHGTDPIFRLVDGSNSPVADVSTEAARRTAYSMLLSKGVIRIGIGIPANAEFTLSAVDDPYGFASAAQLSLFRRPLPTTNMSFLTTVMWDGRETVAGTDHCNHTNEGGKCFESMTAQFATQSNDATLGHAQAANPLPPSVQAQIVTFETSLFTAQVWDKNAHRLTSHHALGGPENASDQLVYYGINDNLGDYITGAAFTTSVFTIYDAWNNLRANDDGDDDHDDTNTARASVARGEALFNSRPITISGVAGLNFASPFNPPLPTSFVGACTTCHDTPNGGDHSIVAPLNIGIADGSRRTADLPLYTLECSSVGVANGHCTAGQTVQVTDPGRSLISGSWGDIGKFKGPILRGLAARAPYFHNGSAKDFDAVIDFYNDRFGMGLSEQEHDDLVAFLRTL